MIVSKFFKALVLVTMFGSLLTGCKLTLEEELTIERAFSDSDINTPPDPSPLNNDKTICHAETFNQPEAEISNSLDVLFVVDSSGSLSEEREAVGDGIDVFIDALPVGLDVQVGVMLAHAENYSGKLYRYYRSLPLVLNSADYEVDELRSILRTRMRRVRSEGITDGGEAGLYSLNRALDADRLTVMKDLGFLRENAGLAVVFVADENDICARYPEGVTPVFDPNLKEPAAFDKYCSDITPASVYHRLKQFQGDSPLVVAGIIYNEGSQFNNWGENEIGYGYKEMIELANGLSIDLAGDHIHQGLDQLGTLVTKSLTLYTEFTLQGPLIDESSLSVRVDGHNEDFLFTSATSSLQLTGYAGRENSLIEVDYCEPAPPVGESPDDGQGDENGSGAGSGEDGSSGSGEGGEAGSGGSGSEDGGSGGGSGGDGSGSGEGSSGGGSEIPPNETPPGETPPGQ